MMSNSVFLAVSIPLEILLCLELNQIFLSLNILTILLCLEFKIFLTTLILLRPNKSIRKTLVLVLTILLRRSNFKWTIRTAFLAMLILKTLVFLCLNIFTVTLMLSPQRLSAIPTPFFQTGTSSTIPPWRKGSRKELGSSGEEQDTITRRVGSYPLRIQPRLLGLVLLHFSNTTPLPSIQQLGTVLVFLTSRWVMGQAKRKPIPRQWKWKRTMKLKKWSLFRRDIGLEGYSRRRRRMVWYGGWKIRCGERTSMSFELNVLI